MLVRPRDHRMILNRSPQPFVITWWLHPSHTLTSQDFEIRPELWIIDRVSRRAGGCCVRVNPRLLGNNSAAVCDTVRDRVSRVGLKHDADEIEAKRCRLRPRSSRLHPTKVISH